MHIMVVNNLYPPIIAGGAERIVSYLCEGLVRRGHRVTVVTTCGPHMEPYPTEIVNGVEVIRFFPPNFYWSYDRNRAPGIRKWFWHARDAWNPAAGNRLKTILAESRPDVFHTHLIDGFSGSIWAVAKRLGMPVIHTAHDYHLLCPRAFMVTPAWNICTRPKLHCQVYRSWHMSTTRHIDLFVSPSQFLLDMHQKAGLRATRQAVVYNGIPQAKNIAPRRRTRMNRVKFLMLTRLTTEKGVQVVLDALAQLPVSASLELAIAGAGPLEQKVREAAALDSRVKFVGFVDGEAKSQLLSQSDYLLLPSLWYENAPVTIIEAAAYGLGMIASDIGAIPEFVERDQTGLLFPPGDAAALAATMMRATENPDILPELSTKLGSVAKRFTLERMIDTYEAHYMSLLGNRLSNAAA